MEQRILPLNVRLNDRLTQTLAIPIALCFYGLYFAFYSFWHDFDSITGDAQDARFVALTLEHTWLWLTGAHASLFNLPMFYPHLNVYAYSDYVFSVAPIFWLFRATGMAMLQSYQAWIIVCCILNFAAFYFLARRAFQFKPWIAGLGAYVFSFALPRLMQFGHSQLIPQFLIVFSAYGAWVWWQNPKSRLGPAFFFIFEALQFVTAYYYFWFWAWTLLIYLIYVACDSGRRQAFREWFAPVDLKWCACLVAICTLLISPFLYHYLLAARESGFRNWITISEGVPRLYSWLAVPRTHWQWPFIPFKDWILALPGVHEHYLSFGLLTWVGIIAGAVQAYRARLTRWLVLPLLAMFAFTLTSGRFSSWVFIAYLVPGARALRSVSRIQVFMLLFWAVVIMHWIRAMTHSHSRARQIGLALWILAFFWENTFANSVSIFTASQDEARISKLAGQVPRDCEVVYLASGFVPWADVANLDAVRVAYLLGKKTINGYSGQLPSEFSKDLYWAVPTEMRVEAWMRAHESVITKTEKRCEIGT